MKPLDQFKRTPARRYDRPPQEEGRIEHAGRFRKRYFDLPEPSRDTRALPGIVCALLVLLLCNASAPMGDVPDVQTRFSDWAKTQNEQTVRQLPGSTPEPGTELYEAVSFNQAA